MAEIYQLYFYVPQTHLETLKQKLFDCGAGKLGEYDRCCWQSKGTGQFRPLPGSNAFLGVKGKLERVEEWKVEMICSSSILDKALSVLKNAHPYEEPAFGYFPINVR